MNLSLGKLPQQYPFMLGKPGAVPAPPTPPRGMFTPGVQQGYGVPAPAGSPFTGMQPQGPNTFRPPSFGGFPGGGWQQHPGIKPVPAPGQFQEPVVDDGQDEIQKLIMQWMKRMMGIKGGGMPGNAWSPGGPVGGPPPRNVPYGMPQLMVTK